MRILLYGALSLTMLFVSQLPMLSEYWLWAPFLLIGILLVPRVWYLVIVGRADVENQRRKVKEEGGELPGLSLRWPRLRRNRRRKRRTDTYEQVYAQALEKELAR